MEYKPQRFIGEPIRVQYKKAPLFSKIPGCPDSFEWQGAMYEIVEMISEWHDYTRRGRMSQNMRPRHSNRASRIGSWGVGRDHYRIRTSKGLLFDIYYDRAPKSVDKRKGEWFLDRELKAVDE
jgi:hypothetical protein